MTEQLMKLKQKIQLKKDINLYLIQMNKLIYTIDVYYDIIINQNKKRYQNNLYKIKNKNYRLAAIILDKDREKKNNY